VYSKGSRKSKIRKISSGGRLPRGLNSMLEMGTMVSFNENVRFTRAEMIYVLVIGCQTSETNPVDGIVGLVGKGSGTEDWSHCLLNI
jgi:hypothetical protein